MEPAGDWFMWGGSCLEVHHPQLSTVPLFHSGTNKRDFHKDSNVQLEQWTIFTLVQCLWLNNRSEFILDFEKFTPRYCRQLLHRGGKVATYHHYWERYMFASVFRQHCYCLVVYVRKGSTVAGLGLGTWDCWTGIKGCEGIVSTNYYCLKYSKGLKLGLFGVADSVFVRRRQCDGMAGQIIRICERLNFI